jgi:hypothetical protein
VLSRIANKPDVRTAALAFVFFNVLDIILTLCVLSAGGYELNPIVRAWLELGAPTAALLKLGFPCLVAALMWHFGKADALRLSAMLFFGVCVFNAFSLAGA